MQMYIREIKEVYPLLYYNIISQLRVGCTESGVQGNTVNGALVWRNTKEGQFFWSYVNSERWEEAKMLYPEYFEPEEVEVGTVLVRSNGLFK